MGDLGLSELGVCGHWISGDCKPSPILSEHRRSMSWPRVEQALILGLKVYSIFTWSDKKKFYNVQSLSSVDRVLLLGWRMVMTIDDDDAPKFFLNPQPPKYIYTKG